MSFIGEVVNRIKSKGDYEVICFGGGSVYLQGVRLIKLSETQMIFTTKHETLTITGGGLAVWELEGDCVIISGSISGFSVEKR